MDNEEIKNMLLNQGRAFTEFKKANDERLKTLETNLHAFAKQARKRGVGASKRVPINNH
ncbi:hypothetical protein C8R31_106140 [Nitrosospira sp. Nsp2]|uniref:hypothetical protein n=1 Tax=Nitrosospira sp. Nsp2 TaxID=136548 RepID=UPI000D480C37|nr:hypothetical protein [Nitrosospira sp. Nsp2]PTR14467.1 hypothetical protein C8R31_106140 [Nitrosospira sp. Nsp2]